MKLIRTSILVVSFLAFAACNSTKGSTNSSTAMNAKCPVSGEALEAGCPTTSFEGQTVGFCCNNCMKKFDGMPAADKKAKVTGSMPAR